MKEASMPDFRNRVVVLYISNSPQPLADGIALEEPSLVSLAGKMFLTGRIPQFAGDDWVTGLESGVAWDCVASYLVFDNKDDYIRRMSSAGKAQL